MNLAQLQRMIREGDLSLDALRYLLQAKGECEWLDFKEELSLTNDTHRAGLARDALAMKNVGGGYIVVGVRDKTWEPVGIPVLPFDTKMLRDGIRKCAGVDVDVDVVQHVVDDGRGPKNFGLVLVRSVKRRGKAPAVAKSDFAHNKPYGVRRGDIYVRRGDSTTRVQSQEELQRLLDELDNAVDEAAADAHNHSPFAVEDGTYRLLEKGFNTFIGRASLRENILNAVTADPRIWIINIHGPGGVGKSALATWVTYEFYRNRMFEAIIQLTAKETVLTEKGISSHVGRSLYSLDNLLVHVLSTFEEPIPEELEEQRQLAFECLTAWPTLIVLDNMETVSDGRILDFVRQLPARSKSKVLMTSRHKTGGWELSIPVTELNQAEIHEFVDIKSHELRVHFPTDSSSIEKVSKASGGLPLAVQWIIGHYKITRNIDKSTMALARRDSPVLEFSFRNIWNVLSGDAKAVLAAMTIFDEPPSRDQLEAATDWSAERIENALQELADVTLITSAANVSDGRVVYAALPITLTFARYQLEAMGDFESRCRQRYRGYNEQLSLSSTEARRFASVVSEYGLSTEMERRAAVLCKRGESELFAGNLETAENLFRRAREIAPNSAYVLAMSSSHELALNHTGQALEFAREAGKLATRKTGALVHKVLARVLAKAHDKSGRIEALKRALEYDRADVVTKHQLGVALSSAGKTEDAVNVFSEIIGSEAQKPVASDTLLMAYHTRVINYRRLGMKDEADQDLQIAKDLIAQYPHLQRHAYRTADLEDHDESL